ncbi:SIMPL domain-containing protein [Candidatus Peregrinibacteria bacterium]|nr:SIMPL domain-containing protein [Candidatus Peregrinibacteria bacterium]
MDSKKSLYIAGTIFLGLLSLALIASFIIPSDKLMLDIQSTTRPESRTITVSGEGSVVVKPDVAKITVSVVSEGKVINRVIGENNDKMNAITKKLKEIGMSADDITTSGYYLYPQYIYPEREMPTISGYRLEQTLALTIRKLDLVDDVIDAATNLGANNIYGLTFTLDDDTEVMNQAREEAFAAAKDKAEKMADAAGVNLGDVYSFNEGYYGGQPTPMYGEAAYGRGGGGGGADIQSGTQEYNVTVNITYEIE